MIDLSTTYLGINLKNPLVVSASPLAEQLGNLRRMEDSGAAAIVFPPSLRNKSLSKAPRSTTSFNKALRASPNHLPISLT